MFVLGILFKGQGNNPRRSAQGKNHSNAPTSVWERSGDGSRVPAPQAGWSSGPEEAELDDASPPAGEGRRSVAFRRRQSRHAGDSQSPCEGDSPTPGPRGPRRRPTPAPLQEKRGPELGLGGCLGLPVPPPPHPRVPPCPGPTHRPVGARSGPGPRPGAAAAQRRHRPARCTPGVVVRPRPAPARPGSDAHPRGPFGEPVPARPAAGGAGTPGQGAGGGRRGCARAPFILFCFTRRGAGSARRRVKGLRASSGGAGRKRGAARCRRGAAGQQRRARRVAQAAAAGTGPRKTNNRRSPARSRRAAGPPRPAMGWLPAQRCSGRD